MKIIWQVILAAAWALTAEEGMASEWWLVMASENSASFIDISSIKKNDVGITRAWIQTVSDDGSSKRFLLNFKCEEEEVGLKSATSYKDDGSSEPAYTASSVSFEPAVPDTNGSTFLEIACADQPTSKLKESYQVKLTEEYSPVIFSREVIFKALKNSPDKASSKEQK